MTEAALAALDRRLDPRSSAPLAVAVSGGGDSMALLHLAAAWASRAARPLLALTVDHGLHPDSALWAEFVRRAAKDLGVEARILHWTGDKPQTGLPAAARAARHALLAEAARAAGARVILLGHTAGDIAESDWMRARGSTLGRLREWGPSPAWPEGRGLMLLRPLLMSSRLELRAWLAARAIGWLEDPANADPRFARSRARGAGLGSAAPESGSEAACPLFEAAGDAPGALAASRTTLGGGLDAHRQLSAALVCASGGSRPPSGQATAALLLRLSGSGEVTATLAGARVRAEGDRLLIGRDPGRRGLARLKVREGEQVVWNGRFELDVQEPGLLGPAGGRAAKLSALDRARLQTAPPWIRPTLPVLETRSGAVRLAPARSLVGERFRLTLGAAEHERDL